MSAFKHIPGPICSKCEQHMQWVGEQAVDAKMMQVFHCKTCDKYAAALPRTNGVKAHAIPILRQA